MLFVMNILSLVLIKEVMFSVVLVVSAQAALHRYANLIVNVIILLYPSNVHMTIILVTLYYLICVQLIILHVSNFIQVHILQVAALQAMCQKLVFVIKFVQILQAVAIQMQDVHCEEIVHKEYVYIIVVITGGIAVMVANLHKIVILASPHASPIHVKPLARLIRSVRRIYQGVLGLAAGRALCSVRLGFRAAVRIGSAGHLSQVA